MDTKGKEKRNGENVLILMVGGPASGKSRIRKELFGHLPLADCDEIKKHHANYDPKHPEIVHEWSSMLAFRKVMAYLSRGESIVYDSTGTNVEKLAMFTSMAHEAGVKVHAVYVTCTVETAIARNLKRARTVDEAMLRQRHQAVVSAWTIIRNIADSTQVIENEIEVTK